MAHIILCVRERFTSAEPHASATDACPPTQLNSIVDAWTSKHNIRLQMTIIFFPPH